jgi:hypothetical protein
VDDELEVLVSRPCFSACASLPDGKIAGEQTLWQAGELIISMEEEEARQGTPGRLGEDRG